MRAEKIVFALLVCFLAVLLASLAISVLPREPVAFFAYGPNLGKSAMESRAGGFVNATQAKLPGFALAFASQDNKPTEFGVATMVEREGAYVSGALYYLTPEQMDSLDRYAGMPNFYERQAVSVELQDGGIVSAQAYFLAGEIHSAAPSRTYMESAAKGLSEWGYGVPELEDAASEN
jgi:hypothetical protein